LAQLPSPSGRSPAGLFDGVAERTRGLDVRLPEDVVEHGPRLFFRIACVRL
jgi:hypothetical protein